MLELTVRPLYRPVGQSARNVWCTDLLCSVRLAIARSLILAQSFTTSRNSEHVDLHLLLTAIDDDRQDQESHWFVFFEVSLGKIIAPFRKQSLRVVLFLSICRHVESDWFLALVKRR